MAKISKILDRDSWIYTVDENNWSMGPVPNAINNYINGICGVVQDGDGKCLEAKPFKCH